MRRLAFLLAAAPLFHPLSARATDPATVGEIDAEVEQRKEAIAKEYEGGEGARLSHAQRRERDAKETAALKEILDKRGVSSKEYERSKATLNREARSEAAQAGKAWKEKREVEAKRASEPKVEPKAAADIPVQRGFDEKNPVLLHDETGEKGEKGAAGAEKAGGSGKTR